MMTIMMMIDADDDDDDMNGSLETAQGYGNSQRAGAKVRELSKASETKYKRATVCSYTAGVEEFTRTFADACDVLRYRSEQFDEPSQVILVSRVARS